MSRGMGQSVADGNPNEVDAERIWKDGILPEDVVGCGGNVFAGVAFAGEEERAGTEGRGMGGEKGLKSRKEVGGDDGLVAGDGSRVRGGAEAGAEGAVDEENGEAAVPGERVAAEAEIVGDEPGAELEEVAGHGGAAGAALEPDEEWGGGERREGFFGFVEGEKEGVFGVDGKIAGFSGES